MTQQLIWTRHLVEAQHRLLFAFEPVKDAKSRINYGVVYPITNSFQVKASFVKGNTYNIGFSYIRSIG